MIPSDHYNFTDSGEPVPIPAKKKKSRVVSVILTILYLVIFIYALLAVMFNWWPISLLNLPF